mmetsp:Transcript_96600/g.144618  ORF Transcript_96600/g.144618 Transcript_96600/m.144618 type:complete len:345 (+) Transcript_96600:419-1453(+)
MSCLMFTPKTIMTETVKIMPSTPIPRPILSTSRRMFKRSLTLFQSIRNTFVRPVLTTRITAKLTNTMIATKIWPRHRMSITLAALNADRKAASRPATDIMLRKKSRHTTKTQVCGTTEGTTTTKMEKMKRRKSDNSNTTTKVTIKMTKSIPTITSPLISTTRKTLQPGSGIQVISTQRVCNGWHRPVHACRPATPISTLACNAAMTGTLHWEPTLIKTVLSMQTSSMWEHFFTIKTTTSMRRMAFRLCRVLLQTVRSARIRCICNSRAPPTTAKSSTPKTKTTTVWKSLCYVAACCTAAILVLPWPWANARATTATKRSSTNTACPTIFPPTLSTMPTRFVPLS